MIMSGSKTGGHGGNEELNGKFPDEKFKLLENTGFWKSPIYYGIAYPDFAMLGFKYVNSIIIDSSLLVTSVDERHTITHEIGHTLTNFPHWGGEPPAVLTEKQRRHIMADGAQDYRFLGFGMPSGKRFNQAPQTNNMLGHRAVKTTDAMRIIFCMIGLCLGMPSPIWAQGPIGNYSEDQIIDLIMKARLWTSFESHLNEAQQEQGRKFLRACPAILHNRHNVPLW